MLSSSSAATTVHKNKVIKTILLEEKGVEQASQGRKGGKRKKREREIYIRSSGFNLTYFLCSIWEKTNRKEGS